MQNPEMPRNLNALTDEQLGNHFPHMRIVHVPDELLPSMEEVADLHPDVGLVERPAYQAGQSAPIGSYLWGQPTDSRRRAERLEPGYTVAALVSKTPEAAKFHRGVLEVLAAEVSTDKQSTSRLSSSTAPRQALPLSARQSAKSRPQSTPQKSGRKRGGLFGGGLFSSPSSGSRGGW